MNHQTAISSSVACQGNDPGLVMRFLLTTRTPSEAITNHRTLLDEAYRQQWPRERRCPVRNYRTHRPHPSVKKARASSAVTVIPFLSSNLHHPLVGRFRGEGFRHWLRLTTFHRSTPAAPHQSLDHWPAMHEAHQPAPSHSQRAQPSKARHPANNGLTNTP